MASYHLSVKSVQRSGGRSATAAAAYRAAEAILCGREGRLHDYTRKAGVEETFILAPTGAPGWAQDRAALWNQAEASETRKNAVVAREWELALPSELGGAARRDVVQAFAQALVDRYGVAVDVAIHAPHREGDQRNHHAHLLTTTRRMGAEGLTEKTRELDAMQTRGAEVTAMRELWAGLQNNALERAGEAARVDHRSLEAQREAALTMGDREAAEALDRAPEVKLGPVASAMERRAMREAEAEGTRYEPVTERGALVHAARQARAFVFEMRERLELAQGAYLTARAEERSRVEALGAAFRSFAEKGGLDEVFSRYDRRREAEEQERRRQEQLERERQRRTELAEWRRERGRALFIEESAKWWEQALATKEERRINATRTELQRTIGSVARQFGEDGDALAGTIGNRADALAAARREAEAELQRQRSRDRGRDGGLEL